ncbi:hypothetical protein [Roseibium sediminicola]|uniref:Uncharacterized protein n=1 Tax=Roseibium sediminicola TaxID=2933272 RepID=A0ABT0H0H5_9HYPH|nr:hypothetical protein [Roseibium sp. CAU 1639]MCK7615183.1 hypothetical protein [Roseibium sp. CAU 1639]
MSSDAVLTALHAVLTGLAAAEADVPEIARNENLDDAFAALDGGAQAYGNMVDGDLERISEALGVTGGQYEIRQFALLELIVKAPSDAERRAAFEAILFKVHAALEAATGGVANWEITGIERLNQATDGDPEAAGRTVEITCEFVSDVPY